MGLLNNLVAASLPILPKALVGKVASRYIAGEKLSDAIRTVRDLNTKGLKATIDVLGEFVADPAEAKRNADAYIKLLDAIASEKLETGASVKLTAIGLAIGTELARQNLSYLLTEAEKRGVFVRIDMEDSPYTDATLQLYQEFRSGRKLGIVIQAYLKRSSDDVKRLLDGGATNVRLCKGIYVEPEAIAYKEREQIRENFLKLLEQMFDGGAAVGIATHDRYLVEQSEKIVKSRNLDSKRYEYQMLLGVLPSLRDEIHSRGHRMRVYVPYGDAWYGYSTRRLKENPAIAGYVFKSLFKTG
ncbi:proline dehydrogenase family protein [bacterium]|nr:proline dehydrogenase family protein [bacterium]